MLIKKQDKASLSNVLNEMVYKEKMTLQELRFFLVYLSKINPKRPDVTKVTFALEEYADLLGVELNEAAIDATTDKMLRYIVHIRPHELEEEELEAVIKCQLFSRCKLWKKRTDEKYYLTFECHEDVKEHLFEFKGNFTSLEVWNIINLHSFQDARMYMLLKQYLGIGERVIVLGELKKMLGIDEKAYPEYPIFGRAVLKKCQKALKEKTDICFEYKAVGRPAHSVKFTIKKNKDYKMPAFLENDEKKAILELPKQTLSDRELERINEFRSVMQEICADWKESDERINELCTLIYSHLISLSDFAALDKFQREVIRMEYYYKILRRARSEGAKNLYKYLISQWDRYKTEISVWE